MYRVKMGRAKLWRKKLRSFGSHKISLILIVFFSFAFIFSATMIVLHYVQLAQEDKALRELSVSVQSVEKSSALQELYERNRDMVGWIRIDGTRIDYPVMHTGDDFYLSHSFDKKTSKSGVPYVDKRCTVYPFGTNTIIYGHNMRNGRMFADLLKYEDKEFFTEHPFIQFDTLHEQQKYEIIAVFKSKIYRNSDKVFKHYNFLSVDNPAVFDEYIANIKALALYDTGVTASYGDELLTLVTCSYHTENGQFVVVAKNITRDQGDSAIRGDRLTDRARSPGLSPRAITIIPNGYLRRSTDNLY